jgi:hypothetical protein
MSRRVILVLLVGLNLALLACLVLSTYSPPAAFAQEAARPGGYVLLAAQAEVSNDAIYLLDVKAQQLHVYRTNYPHMPRQPVVIGEITSRDLARDFAATGGR